jgi:pilus assembly protein CpaF
MGLLDRMENQKKQQLKDAPEEVVEKISDPYATVKQRIHNEIIDKLNKQAQTSVSREIMMQLITEATDNEEYMIPRIDRPKVAIEVFNDVVGYGPIEELLDSPLYSEVMINGPNQIYVESKGKLQLTNLKFRDEQHLMNVVDRIVSQVGRHIDEASPMVDARLPDGSRVNVIIPPISLVGPVVTIRKFGKTPVTAQKLVEWGSITPKMLAFLEACVKGKLNIVVAGGTGSGKTTLLNVLSSYIPEDERIVTIEDAAEVQLKQNHVITLEERPANLEGKGAITIRSLVKNAIVAPDR